MSDINNYNGTVLHGAKDTRAEFTGTGDDVRIGIEVEYQLTSGDRNHKPMNVAENEELSRLTAQYGTEISMEATAQTIEIKTDAYHHDGFEGLCAEFNKHYQALAQSAATLNLQLHEKAHLADVSFPELLAELHPRERAQVFFDHFLQHDRVDMARYFSSISGTQISVSYTDEQHGHDIYKRLVFLTPLLSALLENLSDHITNDQGQQIKRQNNISLAYRLAAYGAKNAVPQSFWAYDDASGFFDGVNDELWQQELFCYYDENGQFTGIPQKEVIKPFADFPDYLKSKANFQLLSSIQWHLIGFSHLPPNEAGDQKRRIELRALDTLPKGQILGVTRLVSALAFDPVFANACDDFIQQAGFNLHQPGRSKSLWLENLTHVVEGDTTKTSCFGTLNLAQAQRKFSELLAPFQGRYPEFQSLIAAASEVHVCHGLTAFKNKFT